MNRKPMSMEHFFALETGDQFVVYYAKDDNPEYIRLDYELCTVESNKNGVVYDDVGDDWECTEDSVPNLQDNLFDTSRGYAYFFFP